MNASRTKIVKNDTDKYLNIPINMQWDFMGRDDSISEYEAKATKEVTGIAARIIVTGKQIGRAHV